MSENVQAMIGFNSANATTITGVQKTTLDALIGVVFVTPKISFIGASWVEVQRSAAGGANVGGQFWGKHNSPHVILDPTHAGPPYILRICETITPVYGSNSGRIFFGFGEFTDIADPASLVGLGFYCDKTGNWFALMSDDLGDRERFDTDADTNQPRFLRMELDGNLKAVRWYVDEVLVRTHAMLTPLDKIETGTDGGSGLLFNDVVIQSAAGHNVIAYIGSGLTAQMSIITDEPEPVVVVPVVIDPVGQGLTYQRVINLARSRHPKFDELILDDNQVVDELNALAMSMISIASLADHSAFQQVVNWNADVFPLLDQSGGQVDLRDYSDIVLPGWVTGVYAIEAVRLDGSKIVVEVKRKESETRDRLQEEDSVVLLRTTTDPKRIPRGFKVWNDALGVFTIQKDEVGDVNPWQDVVDANFVVAGVRVAMKNRGDLTNNISMPFQALLPLVERYAVTLAGRAGLDLRWKLSQRAIAEEEMEKWREFIGEFDMMEDEPFDPEIQ